MESGESIGKAEVQGMAEVQKAEGRTEQNYRASASFDDGAPKSAG